MKNKRTPDIRFPGFPGDWEQCNLGNISTKIGSGKTPKGGNENYKSEGIPLLRSQNIFNDKVNFNDVVYITTEIDEDMANSRVQKGDVLLNITGASIGRSAVYKLNHKANVNQHVAIIRPFREVNPYFIQLNITSEKGQKQIELNQAGGGREGLNFQQIAKLGFYFPSLVEQDKVGDFFIQLDNTIALQQQELTILKQTKQGFLQKMFPKEGEFLPEVRFPGFTGDWELLKADEIFHSISDKNHANLPVLSASQEKGMVYRNEIGINIKYDEKSTKNYKRVLPGQFVIHLRSFQGGFAFSSIAGITSPAYTVLDFKNKEKHYSLFWKYILASNTFIKRLETVTYGIRDGRSISFSDFSTLKFRVPSYNEQIKIGNFFKCLDDTITLHQRELDALKETKKALLQKMLA
ncbi:Type I restriction-modification system, specificity subunit S [Bacillus mycoides]|uniref:restriction endonuclease subunit S n=1 Tax=Bacillus mycoides TaxID=1405 RepID=UPI0005C9D3C1|nr:restriction endonuclease subunit S [Bacillus mycoides]KIV62486.1 Type I restriction-modification system, specificity subunit S [Bacillus mycoides]